MNFVKDECQSIIDAYAEAKLSDGYSTYEATDRSYSDISALFDGLDDQDPLDSEED